jgi:hypothetical protein
MKVAGIRVPAFPLLFCVFARSFPVVCTRDPAPGKFRGPAPAAGPARVFAMACTLYPCRVELNVTFPSKPKFVRLPIRSKSLAIAHSNFLRLSLDPWSSNSWMAGTRMSLSGIVSTTTQ